ncbi:MAG: hypothetical protein F6J93_20030 [Oscillatoria sp. SIO1A7]|nr:hypothetical protein [Oscillatoria sp. SIO1A7]
MSGISAGIGLRDEDHLTANQIACDRAPALESLEKVSLRAIRAHVSVAFEQLPFSGCVLAVAFYCAVWLCFKLLI